MQGSRPWVTDPHQWQRPQPRGSRPQQFSETEMFGSSPVSLLGASGPAHRRSLVGYNEDKYFLNLWKPFHEL